MTSNDQAADSQPEALAVSSQLTYVERLRQHYGTQSVQCWMLVTLAALVSWPVGLFFGNLLALVFPALEVVAQSLETPAWLLQLISGSAILGEFGISLMAYMFASLFPGFVIAAALTSHNRTYRLCKWDLVWGSMGIMLADEQFAQSIENVKRERYRPKLFPIDLTGTITGRIRHFAYYNLVYYRLSRSPGVKQVPQIIGGNCWFDGSVLVVSFCTACIPVTMWFLARNAVMWPRILGIHRAVIEMLEGRFDNELESQYQQLIS